MITHYLTYNAVLTSVLSKYNIQCKDIQAPKKKNKHTYKINFYNQTPNNATVHR